MPGYMAESPAKGFTSIKAGDDNELAQRTSVDLRLLSLSFYKKIVMSMIYPPPVDANSFA